VRWVLYRKAVVQSPDEDRQEAKTPNTTLSSIPSLGVQSETLAHKLSVVSRLRVSVPESKVESFHSRGAIPHGRLELPAFGLPPSERNYIRPGTARLSKPKKRIRMLPAGG